MPHIATNAMKEYKQNYVQPFKVCCRTCEKVLSPNPCFSMCKDTWIIKEVNHQLVKVLPFSICEPKCKYDFFCTMYKVIPEIVTETMIEKETKKLEQMKALL